MYMVYTYPILSFPRILESVHHWFNTRSHLAVMDALSHSCLATLRDHFTQLHNSDTPELPRPLLHLSVDMAIQSSLAIQLVQVPKKMKKLPTETTLKEITRHMTLLNIFVSGLKCHALFQTSKEMGGVSKRILSSVEIVGRVNLPTIQTSICCLVPKSDANRTLLSLSPEQSQLLFEISSSKDLTLCTLLEAGLKDSCLTLVAKLLTSEVHEDGVLEWNHVHQYGNIESVSPSHAEVESKNNHFMVDAVLPRVWSQVATTHTGIASSVTGGLDLLVLYEALEVWHEHIGGVVSVAGKLFSDKTSHDRHILLTIIANAARNSMLSQRYFNPVHSDITLSIRRSVVFACLQQLWDTLPAFAEGLVSGDEKESYERELVATLLAISARLYSQQEEADDQSLSCDTSIQQNGRSETGSVGYISISPSPSELAIPNATVADFLDLRDIDYDPVLSKTSQPSLLALRESMLPLFAEAGLKIAPQLRPICHNNEVFLGEVGVALKEVSVFVTPPPYQSTSYTRHTDTPVIIAKHIDVRSSVKYTTETAPTQPDLSLLPSDVTTDTQSAKVNLSSSCIISVEGISLTVTIPLLKLGRHMIETAHYRNHLTRLAEIFDTDNLVTPRPGSKHSQQQNVEVPEEMSFILPSAVVRFTKSIVSIVKVREVKGEAAPIVLSPIITVQSPSTSKLPSPQEEGPMRRLLRPQSLTSSFTSDDVAIAMENPLYHEALSDTVGYDTQDSLHHSQKLTSQKLTSPKSYTSVISKTRTTKDHTSSVVRSLSLSPSQLLYTGYGLLRIKSFEVIVKIQTTRASVLVEGVSACVDVRKATKKLESLPTYLSAAATLQKGSLVVSDRGLPEADVLSFKAQPIYVSGGMCEGVSGEGGDLPTYRCLMKVRGVELNVPQSPVIIHRRYQILMPSFTAVYREVFAKSEAASAPTTPSAPVVNIADVKLPPKLPQGFVHFSLDEASVILSPLPSLTVTYTVSHMH